MPQYDPMRIYAIPLEEIFPDDEFNSRGIIDPTEVRELAADIREKGLTQPVIVQVWEDSADPKIKFRLVAGYRRYKAHQMNKAQTINALVKEGISDIDARIINLSENVQRSDLNVLQEARALDQLRLLGITQEKAAERLGKSRGWVQERFYLLDLPDEIQEDAAAGIINLKQVRQIWSLPSVQQQYEFVRLLKDAKLAGVRKEPTIRDVKVVNEKKMRSKQELLNLQETIRENFGNGMATRVIAFTIGELSDLEMHRYMAEEARKTGKFYAIPAGLEGKHAKVTPSRLTDVPEDDADLDLVEGMMSDESETEGSLAGNSEA